MGDIVPIHPVPSTQPAPESDPLWREALGRSLRAARVERGARLVDIAERAGISPQYLSEIERGRKEPSSEMIAAVTGALGIDLGGLLADIAVRLGRHAVLSSRRSVDRRVGFRVDRPSGRPAGPVLMAV